MEVGTKITDSGVSYMAKNYKIQPVIKKFRDIKPEKLEWLWKYRIPLGKVTGFVGDPDVGKTILTMDLAAHVSTGKPWPDLPNETIEAGSVIILTAEDDLNDTVRPRLEAAGANVDRVVTIQAIKESGQNNEEKERNLYNLIRGKDYDVLVKAMEQIKDVRLVIIDPITAYMGDKNSNSNTEVRGFLAPLAKLAAVSGAAIVGINHLNKDPSKPATYRTLGSIGFVAAARAVWLVTMDPEDKDKRLLLSVKGNLAKERTGLAFRLVDEQVETDKGPVTCPKCRFEPGVVDKTADEILAVYNKKHRGPTRIEEAMEWLEGMLSDGPKYSSKINDTVKNSGIRKRTLDRAKKELGVESSQIRNKDGKVEHWKCSLPKKETKVAKDS